jgi:hypothetical protein
VEGFSFSICVDQSRGCEDPGSYRPSRRDSITIYGFAQSSCVFDRSIPCTAHVCHLVARSRDGSSNGVALDTRGLEARCDSCANRRLSFSCSLLRGAAEKHVDRAEQGLLLRPSVRRQHRPRRNERHASTTRRGGTSPRATSPLPPHVDADIVRVHRDRAVAVGAPRIGGASPMLHRVGAAHLGAATEREMRRRSPRRASQPNQTPFGWQRVGVSRRRGAARDNVPPPTYAGSAHRSDSGALVPPPDQRHRE